MYSVFLPRPWYWNNPLPDNKIVNFTMDVQPEDYVVTPEFDSDDYRQLRNDYPSVKFVVADGDYVIAFDRATHLPECCMIKVAISYCAPEDTFDKKTGKYQALLKLERGEYIQLPLMAQWLDTGTKEFKQYLLDLFDNTL